MGSFVRVLAENIAKVKPPVVPVQRCMMAAAE
jgi:hypothetical protein